MGQRDILLVIAKLLQKYKIPFLLTGSFAVSYYGYPRATHDIDFVIEISNLDYLVLEHALQKLGESYLIDWKDMKNAIVKHTQFDILHLESSLKIDFWILKMNDFDQVKMKRKNEIEIERLKIPLISPEDLILTKLLWCKDVESEKHMRDCAGIIKVQGNRLDRKYLISSAKKLGLTGLLDEVSEMEY